MQPNKIISINIPLTSSGEKARVKASSMTDSQLRQWCDEISQRDFFEPFQPDIYPWLDGSRSGMIDFIVGSFL